MASVNDKLDQTTSSNTGRPVTATLTGAGHSIAGTSVTINAATNWPTTTGIHFSMYKTTTVGSLTVKDTTTQTDWKGTLSGTTISNMTLTGGTDQAYSAGDIIEMTPTAKWAKDIYDWGIAEHNQDGTHAAVTATSVTASGTVTASSFVTTGGADTNGWTVGLGAPDTVAANGNRSYTLTYNSVNKTSIVSNGMRLRTTRTVAAPTQCTSLNGTTQYWVKTSPSAMTFTNNFVVSAWIKLSSYNGSQMVIASRYNGTSGWMFLLNASGQVRLDGYNAGSSNFASSLSYQSVPLNKWVHVAAQLDMTTTSTGGTNNYIMIDGVEVPNAVSRGGTNPTALVQAGNLEIGGQNGGTTPFPGKIAQVAIYNAKVTEANVLATISQGLSGSETSLISAYSFNNSTNDLSANANNLSAGAGSPTATNADSPFGGQADGTISSTLDYAEILSATFSTNTTLTVRVPDTNTIPTTGGISALSYSTQYSPYGCPRIENIGGHIPSLASFSTASTTAVVMSGATIGVYIPAGRRVKITAVGSQFFNSGAAQSTIGLYAGASASALTTVLQSSTAGANTAAGTYPVSTSAIYTNTTAGTVYFSLALSAAASGTSTIGNAAMWVEYA